MTPDDTDGNARRDEESDVPNAEGRTTRRDAGVAADGRETDEWPVALRGVTEVVVATLGPNDLYNQAALGLHAGEPVTARTWGRTRTRRNVEERGEAYVQFTRDPVAFVEAALGIYETDAPLLPETAAWVRVTVEPIDSGNDAGTEWTDWRLEPVTAAVRDRTVPTISRGHGAVIEATVAASRLNVDAYDDTTLLDRLSYLESVVETCGDDDERRAFDRLSTLVPWRDRDDR